MFTLARAMLTLLNYFFLGTAPAMIRAGAADPLPQIENEDAPFARIASPVLDYARPGSPLQSDHLANLYRSGLGLSAILGTFATIALVAYSQMCLAIHPTARTQDGWVLALFIFLMGFGFIARLISDPASAVLQLRGRIALDNALLTAADFSWPIIAIALFAYRDWPAREFINCVGAAFCISSIFLLIARQQAVGRVLRAEKPDRRVPDSRLMLALLKSGGVITLGQVADFLYAPTSILILSYMDRADAIAAYTPALQIDSAMLLLVSGLASVMLPTAALTHARGDVTALRRLYVRGTLASVVLLAAVGAAIWVASPFIFRLWFGDSMAATQQILYVVLIHTIVGGSAAVGRSILIGTGRSAAYTVAAVAGGIVNVMLGIWLGYGLGLGLEGVVLGTVTAVVLRCAIWQPWYVLRSIRKAG